jgi:hypothetical protein
VTDIRLRRRATPDRIRHLAGKLREGERHREWVALALDVLADESPAVTDAEQLRAAAAVLRNRMKAKGKEPFMGMVFVRTLERWADREWAG